ncbi:endosomal/lysosomal proton channel TMEM175-like [Hydra vulgaris]|uniref:endosomal/lysosomal proton channel TMEM175-like n=1 Tax=Hydra vulgaris TaxID=6087 RepID=UPI0032EA1476
MDESNIEINSKNQLQNSSFKDKNNLDSESNTTFESGDLGDVFTSNRMLGYIDAIMATSATFLVVPIKNIKELESNNTFSHYLINMRTEFIMFFLGFTIVLTIWENMNVRSLFVKKVDDFILTFIILEMLATIVLPFAIYLQGSYPDQYVPIILTCCVLAIIQVLNIFLIFYAIKNTKLLHTKIQNWSLIELRRFRNIVLVRPVLCLILVIIGGILCLVHYAISWGFIAVLTLMPIFRNLFLYARRRMKTSKRIEKYEFYYYFSKKNIPKERIEIMSDAAFAIIVSLIILDITTKFSENVDSDISLNHQLKDNLLEFYTFLATFGIVSTLWYVNHCVFHLFRTIPAIALYIQKYFLAFCCLCPLAANMILKFGTKGDESSSSSICYASLIVFCASMGNFFLFLYGFLTKDKYFYKWATFGRSFRTMSQQNKYIIFKTLNVPFWSLLCALCSLSPPKIALYILCGCFLATPTSFFIAKLVFMTHVGKYLHFKKSYLKNDVNIKTETLVQSQENVLNSNNSLELELAHENQISLEDEKS